MTVVLNSFNYIEHNSLLVKDDVIFSFTPLVKSTAKRYEGRGAEFEDLVQEGYVALLKLIPKCRDEGLLPLYLKQRLPGYVRDAANRLRCYKNGDEVSLDDCDSFLPDRSIEEKIEADELREMLEHTLTHEELDITQALVEGFTQKEIARNLDVSQQAVHKRLCRIRLKLRALLKHQYNVHL